MTEASIERGAPALAAAETRISAPIELVWQVLTDLQGWPGWNKDVSRMVVSGPIAPGSEFRRKSGGAGIVSTIREVSSLTRIAWTGRTMSIRAVHVWRFARQENATLVQTEESFSGLLPQILPGMMRNMLRRTLEKGLGYLKVECEKRATRNDAQVHQERTA